MLVLTGNECSCKLLVRRLAAKGPWKLQEIRADLLEDIDSQLIDIVRKYPDIIFKYNKPDAPLFSQIIGAGAAYVDMDYSWPKPFLQQYAGDKLIVSAHLFDHCPEKWPTVWQKLLDSPGHILKLAVTVNDAAELPKLCAMVKNSPKPLVLLAMGQAGQLTRFLYRQIGSYWTYVCHDGNSATAAGQPVWDQLQTDKITKGFFALLGGEQINNSPGPQFYRQFFPYFPVVTTDNLAMLLPWLRENGLLGASITMPNKRAACRLCTRLSTAAAAIGAINTLYWQDGQLYGENTDYLAMTQIASLLTDKEAGAKRVKQAVILGRGGAARAIGQALTEQGFTISVFTRNNWDALPNAAGDLLVNATPVGHKNEDILINPRNFRLIVDLVMADNETPLVRRAKAQGRAVIDGYAFWQKQAQKQLEIFQGILRRR